MSASSGASYRFSREEESSLGELDYLREEEVDDCEEDWSDGRHRCSVLGRLFRSWVLGREVAVKGRWRTAAEVARALIWLLAIALCSYLLVSQVH